MLALGRPGLQNSIVNADVLALGVETGKRFVEVSGAPCGGDLLKIRRGFREVFTQSAGERACAPHKNAAVPVVISRSHKLLGPLLIRLLSKPLYPEEF